jgi:hypothetical protein
VIPIDVDALLATQKAESPFSGVTGVTGVTPSTIPSTHAGERHLTPVTPPQSSRCGRCDKPSEKPSPCHTCHTVTLARCDRGNEPQGVDIATVRNFVTPATPATPEKGHRALLASPPPYPGHAVGAPFRPGQQVWLYRWDDQTARFAAPVTIVQLRTLWPGEQDIGWCNATGEVTWHNARLAVAVATQELRRHPQTATQE